ncbi:asparagine synthetase domain containing protein 1 [Zymoseptoria brevis]|uniref:Asparagine synthetase domain containing protein 1 n=1 Tax=Zymoseptoria brevis TaxID=1047168 RepID=A0A0F4GIX5_9PEZI|nr:asparagine synthetase domain containing protein 1 [Zymoseptoria brevis]
MCGIFCSISRHAHIEPSDGVKSLLHARGPDAASTVCVCDRVSQAFITCLSTVLSLRGSTTTNQPFRKTNSESTLCWNGEAWEIRGERPDGNDTSSIFDVLQQTTSATQGDDLLEATTAVAAALAEVAGPYAFVFFDDRHSRIYFGRDFLGRRSLLKSVDVNGNILLSSITDVLTTNEWSEVEADGIYCIDLTKPSTDAVNLERWGDFTVVKVPYQHIDPPNDNSSSVIPELSLNRDTSPACRLIDGNSQSVGHLESLLIRSVSLRVLNIPEPPRRSTDTGDRKRAKLAILFSGGLDCTTIARLCHGILPHTEPIDLLNVAFENPRVHKTAGAGAFELCPDRITGRASHTELCSVCPEREWRFVAVDVPYTETQEHRKNVLRLMHPHNTEMDLSISYALYFATRGIGQVAQEADEQVVDYVSSARVLLSGLGADELFAGYTRHATAFRRNGFTGLLDELDIDIGRLGKRNLGRDDRVISNWGKEARFPFLDEKLVQWALAAPVEEKCGFGEPENALPADECGCAEIEPGKKVLRCLAWKLGMKKVAIEKKRAIQFGARTAKMETGKSKGTHVLT